MSPSVLNPVLRIFNTPGRSPVIAFALFPISGYKELPIDLLESVSEPIPNIKFQSPFPPCGSQSVP